MTVRISLQPALFLWKYSSSGVFCRVIKCSQVTFNLFLFFSVPLGHQEPGEADSLSAAGDRNI